MRTFISGRSLNACLAEIALSLEADSYYYPDEEPMVPEELAVDLESLISEHGTITVATALYEHIDSLTRDLGSMEYSAAEVQHAEILAAFLKDWTAFYPAN